MAFDEPLPAAFPVQARGLWARVAPITDMGRKRRHNEDSHLILPPDGSGAPPSGEVGTFSMDDPGVLLAVADGMGGYHKGEVASRMCVEHLAREVPSHLHRAGPRPPDLAFALQRAVVETHRAVFAFSQEYSKSEKMGTTLTAVLISGVRADVAQVGDSRAYLLREGNLILLTQDQTIGNQLRKRGADISLVNPQIQDLLTQAVGAQPDINVVMSAVDIAPQDLLLLCSDGLYKVVSPEEMVDILEMEIPLAEKAGRLITRGNENGGPDNITAILVEICQGETAS